MYLMIIQLRKIEYREDILLGLTSCGIQNASVFEGENLDNMLERSVPIFTGLIRSEDEKSKYALLILSTVEKREKINLLIQLLKEADIDIENEDILQLILLPVDTLIDDKHKWEKHVT